MEKQEIVKQEKSEKLTASERFTNSVLKSFGNNVAGALSISEYQKNLVQGYFISIDRALKKAEEERLRKNEANSDHKYDNDLPIIWQNVNLNDLSLDLVHYARIGLDMAQDNMLFPIPFKNKKTNQYDITLMEGYNGKRYIAEKYALEKPIAVTVEVVYSTDTFKPIKKGFTNKIESYEFSINNPFERGEIIGGFAYIEFLDSAKNELVIMSMAEIEKRKPQYASANFWGGTIKQKNNGKWEEVEIEGWKDEMVRKTLIREAYGTKHLPIDPQKIDENYQYLKEKEANRAEAEAEAEIAANANKDEIVIEATTGEVTESPTVTEIDDLP